MNGKDLRLEKLFSKGSNAVIVAIDHGMSDGPIPEMIYIKKTAEKINPCVDRVLLSPGMLKQRSLSKLVEILNIELLYIC